MKVWKWIMMSLFVFAAPVQSAEVLVKKVLLCSKDINAWGHPSACICPESSRYEERLGSCVRGEYDPILVSGQIVVSSVGMSHKKRIALKTFENPELSYDLILTLKDLKKVSTLDGIPFEVEGDFIELPAANSDPRPSIIVKALRWLD